MATCRGLWDSGNLQHYETGCSRLQLRGVEGLALDLGAINDVVEELLANAGLAAGLVPGLSAGVGREGAALWILLLPLGAATHHSMHQGFNNTT